MTETKINMEKAERIAYADTKHLGRPRWSELSVFYLHEPTAAGKRYLSMSVGMSNRDGEKALTDRLVTFGINGALELFDDSPIGRAVKAEALDWVQHFEDSQPGGQPQLPRAQPETDEEALALLFGKENVTHAEAGRAFDMGESSVRMARKPGSAGVRVPLLALAPYIDVAAFQAAQQQER